MNFSIIRTLVIDALFWVGVWFCFQQPNSQVTHIFSNMMNLTGGLALLAGLSLFLLEEDKLKDIITKISNRPAWFNSYSKNSCMLEAFAFAALGWFWLAGIWVLMSLGVYRVNSFADKLNNKGKNNG